MWAEPGSVVTVVSEKELTDFYDAADRRRQWRHRKRHCASWHSTLTKLTLPHDANSVVQNKKGTQPKPKKKTQNTHKGDGTPYTLLTTLPYLAVVCAFAR